MPSACFRNCQPFLQRQISLIAPRVVIGLGQRAFESVLRTFNLPVPVFREAVNQPHAIRLPNGSILFAV
ncbi:uracil-DNA glycosylase family protein, partial [Rhizobium leguminosarum]|uniref:uracil-DNA glycosylase family protein n=1 Tax=Rhizobium leguminosarum TaxID=384 RepID=UPI003F97FC9E